MCVDSVLGVVKQDRLPGGAGFVCTVLVRFGFSSVGTSRGRLFAACL